MPVRIYDIAKKLGIESKEVLAKAKELGITTARVPSSSLDKITAEYLEEQMGYKPVPPPPPTPAIEAVTEAKPAVGTAAKAPTEAAAAAVEVSPTAETRGKEPETVAAISATPAPVVSEELAAKTKESIQPAELQPVVETAVAPAIEPKAAITSPDIGSARVATAEPPLSSTEAAAEVPKGTEPEVETEASPQKPEPVIQVIKATTDAPEIKVIIQSPAPAPAIMEPAPAPPAPAAPRVGDKVGFIVLPQKAPPKTADKGGSATGTARPVGRGDQAKGRHEHKSGKAFGQKGGFKSSAPGRPGAGAGKTLSGKPGPAEPARYVPPTTGELLTMKPPIVVRMLAELLKRKPFQLIADLMELGVFANVNQTIDEPIAQRLSAKYGFRFEVEKRERGAGVHTPEPKPKEEVDDKPEDLKPRPPVVTIMGHVDHGKTTLLDGIRKSNVAAGEAGGITQHIGAYTISFPHPERPKDVQQITFLDTPGHAAFSAMRARGANVTDIVVLVVAANDGVMPQTLEAISHARAANVPIIVAVNKCDHPNAIPMRVRQQLQEQGLVCEEWGGHTIFQDLSALTKQGVDKLLELILLQAEMMELKANPDRAAKGNVIESGLEPGGPTATVLVRKGTLHVGDIILCGAFYGKARALISEEGKRLKTAGPSVAVKLLGINGVPEAGLPFTVEENEKTARDLAEERAQEQRDSGVEDRPKITLETLFETLSPDSAKVLKIVVKSDMQGSAEAILEALKKIDSSKVSLEIIHSAVGIITESDVLLASASKAIVIGFHTRVDSEAAEAAKREGVQIKLYSIIYELIDQVKDAMAGMLEPVSKEVVLGAAEVKKIFGLSKGGNVAGCVINNGRVARGRCRVSRRRDIIFEGAINSIRRFQDEVNEVRAGMECGIRLDGFNEYQPGDLIESYTIEKIAQKL